MTIRTPTSTGSPRTPTRSRSGSDLVLTLWTASPALAARAEAAGVDRVGLDLESHGKAERQSGLGTWLSPHTEAELPPVRAVLRRAACFVRVNPVGPGTPAEVDRVIAAGATVLMLPMWTSAAEVAAFVAAVRGRARVVPLLETAEAVGFAADVAALDGVDEVHVGLNDLTLSLGLPNRFTLLASQLLADVTAAIHAAGCPLGVGGLGRPADTGLPIPPDLLYASLVRLGATRALLSRSFLRDDASVADLTASVRACRERFAWWLAAEPEAVEAAHDELAVRAATLPGW